jgi:molybdate transport system permease protein
MKILVRAGASALGGTLVVLIVIPIAALIATTALADFGEAIDRGLWPALLVSLTTTSIAALLAVILGTPLAWWLARTEHRGARIVEAVVRLPAVTPPAVAGVALLAALGRQGLLGAPIDHALGVGIPFTTAAVVLAQLFVCAPFYVLPAAEAFRDVDAELLLAARSVGASPLKTFARVALPLATPALISGLAVAWARALGEFGATLVFAGNFPGVTQTLPIAIYVSMEGDLGPARAMSVVLLAWAVILFGGLRALPIASKR